MQLVDVWISALCSVFSVLYLCLCCRVQRERAELEQNFAREISNLVQRLSTEKDQLEAELKLKHDQEVMVVRWVVASRCLTNTYNKLYTEGGVEENTSHN